MSARDDRLLMADEQAVTIGKLIGALLSRRFPETRDLEPVIPAVEINPWTREDWEVLAHFCKKDGDDVVYRAVVDTFGGYDLGRAEYPETQTYIDVKPSRELAEATT